MRKININAVTENESKSPKGKYHHHTKDVSVALGRDPRSLDLLKRHPFSRKWAVGQPSERIILKGNETEYWDGEE